MNDEDYAKRRRRMMAHYRLKDGKVVTCELMEWAEWFQNSHEERIIGRTRIGKYRVSTVFLGLDHGFFSEIPVLWETMVFVPNPRKGKKMKHLGCKEPDEIATDRFECERCGGSYEQAAEQHARKVLEVCEATGAKAIEAE